MCKFLLLEGTKHGVRDKNRRLKMNSSDQHLSVSEGSAMNYYRGRTNNTAWHRVGDTAKKVEAKKFPQRPKFKRQ